jgi:large subunit ribosomal protein L21e
MGHPAGLRAGTRYAFSRNFREKGMIRLSTYLKTYRYDGAFGGRADAEMDR